MLQVKGRQTAIKDDFTSHINEHYNIWRIVLGLFLVGTIYVLSNAVLLLVFKEQLSAKEFVLGNNPKGLALLLSTFLPIWIGFAVVLPLLHRRTPFTLLGPTCRVNWQHFRIAGFVLVPVLVVCEMLLLLTTLLLDLPNYKAHMLLELPQWGLWLLPILLLLFVQIGAEELVFRGYILQMIRARGGGFWLAIAIPSLAFGLMHYDPITLDQNAFLLVIHTTVVGILLCQVTLRTGNLGAALGLHFANNFIGFFLFGANDFGNGMALFSAQIDPKSPMASATIISQTLVIISVYKIWARRMDNAHR